MHDGEFIRWLAIGVAACLSGATPLETHGAEPLRAGIIGCDTSHCIAFTELINAPDATDYRAQVQVVAAFPGGSDDIPSSRDRVPGYVEKLRGMGVEIVDSIETLLEKVDVVLLESVDGRVHLAQVKPVFAAGKRVFIDKPLAGSLADAVEIARLGKESGVPWYSCSALRFGGPATKLAADASVGDVLGCDVFGPCTTEPHHPDLYWYGVHGVETLFALMGAGCETVTRVAAADADVVAARWSDGRLATFRGLRAGAQDYGATVFGTKAIASARGFAGYGPHVDEICNFFVTGKPPVPPEVTIEMFAFMEAADESKRRGGEPVSIEATLQAAGAAHASR
jgi:predicted dehydrogenase